MSTTAPTTTAASQHLDILDEIDELRRIRKAVILAHYYQEPDIQDLADHIGDSLQLARAARDTDAEVILFCGVHFMAETAKILNPGRIVIVPDMKAGCSLADAAPAARVAAWKAAHPGAALVSYINCSAGVKAVSDIICTSSNAVRVIESIPRDQQILFCPDKNLGRYLMQQTGRDMELWPGACIVHETFSEQKLIQLKVRHPAAKVICHPECEPQLLQHADHIGSTSSLLRYATTTPDADTFIVGTEPGILHQMQKAAPHRTFLPLPGMDETCACNECPHMRRNTLEKIRDALRDLAPRIEMPEPLRLAALQPMDRMMALG
ncbi:MAG: quinolinate synthase NadA [Deltaproteobacteria bacterium]|nr:quinolinate synthase NadA [Deltaproteobacteria bacterium]